VRLPLLPLLALFATHFACAQPVGSMTVRTDSVEIDGHPMVADIYAPAGAARGVAVVAHGWTRSRARHRDLGEALAQAGVVAVVPDLPNVMDLWGNGDALAALARALEAGTLGLPPVDRAHLVMVGTSAGGLATLIASKQLKGVAGWVGLDPVDRTGSGLYAASKLETPAIVLLADDSACNLFGSGRSLARAVPRLVRSTRIRGASHCDFEGPTNRTCTVICGESTAEKRAEAREAAVAATLELLAGEAGPDGEAAAQRASAPRGVDDR